MKEKEIQKLISTINIVRSNNSNSNDNNNNNNNIKPMIEIETE
jgi:hypothetical protein